MKERLETSQKLRREVMNKLLWLVINNGSKPINEILNAGADLHLSEYVVLINAAQYGGYKEMVEFFLKNGAGINEKDNDGNTSLILAARKGHKEVIEILLKRGANINEKDNNGATALIAAAQNGHKEAIEVLIKYKVSVDRGIRGYTALMFAAQNGHYKAVEILLKNGASMDREVKGESALIMAARNGHKRVVEVLLENGANINKKNNSGYSALMLAALNGHFDVAIVLIKNNANIYQANNDGKTAVELTSNQSITSLLTLVISYHKIPKLRDTIVYWLAKAVNRDPNYEQFGSVYNSRMMESNFLPEDLKDEIENYIFPVKPSNNPIVNPSGSEIDSWVAKIQAEQQRKELDKEGLRIS
ncbi:hypothetical protein I862_02080 [endosymbiont of Acanthamoeba sp. UWC8]|uniref:ankyrin repeat domain-containing protein n=1 Tax=endosymbiont of Acanthamoeba sp. UWC8 TaxID=86106 RepID=UPI0004D0CBF6|nr:ankyrin repeat domain-containing protein [endosymbiont of Acanthamoeba sp. UWC8]AIF80979.1 hypothetical protein I862_02080 [endosymbiont of Acanthamoeba sp. UWC8]